MSRLQETVLKERKDITEEDILLEAKEWVTYLGQMRTKETKCFFLVEIYWMTKAMVAQVVAQQKLENKATQHAVHILEAKFELFCKAQFRIHFHEKTLGDQEAK
jgi:hypothetical protein